MTYAVVVPTAGRPSLDALLRGLADGPGPEPARVVVVDDRRVARAPLAFCTHGLRVEVLRGPGRGPAAARNAGWRACDTEWIAFLDDDVVPEPGWRAALVADLAAAGPDVGGSQGRITVPLPADRAPTDWERNVAGLEAARWATADLAYRRSALEAVGGFDERFPRAYREDADIGLRITAAGWRIVAGSRGVLHPVGPAPWTVSLAKQAGNADDVLMRWVHGRDWRERAGVPPGRRPRHLVIATAGAVAAGAAAVTLRGPLGTAVRLPVKLAFRVPFGAARLPFAAARVPLHVLRRPGAASSAARRSSAAARLALRVLGIPGTGRGRALLGTRRPRSAAARLPWRAARISFRAARMPARLSFAAARLPLRAARLPVRAVRTPLRAAGGPAAVGRRAGALVRARAVAVAPRVSAAAALVWAAGTAELAWARIAPGPKAPREIATMAVTSSLMPFWATGWWLRGWLALPSKWLAKGPRPALDPPAPVAHPLPGDAVRTPSAVLFDRDGTLVIDVPFNGDPARVELVPGARAAVERLRAAGIPTAVVSNQSGIARGLLTEDQVRAVNARVEELLGPLGPWHFCPHGPDEGCACRKPAPGLVLRAARDLGVDPQRCAVVGDIGADVEAARAAGARGVLVPTPRTRPEEVAAAPEVAADIEDAIDRLLGSAA